MFAPVNLPDGASVVSLRCGGSAPLNDFRIVFTLRRNQPQQANVDMASVSTNFAGVGFETVTTSSITSPVVSNASFNYYMMAEADAFDVGLCPGCLVGYCRIGYTADTPFP
jgi:hypothetical protein